MNGKHSSGEYIYVKEFLSTNPFKWLYTCMCANRSCNECY